MKYKRKKLKSSDKYVSELSADAVSAKKRTWLKRKSTVILAVFCLLFSLARFGVLNMSNLNSWLNDTGIASAWNSAVNFVSDKTSFISRLGKKGAEFCYQYLRGDDGDSEQVFAEEEETDEKMSDEAADIEVDSGATVQTAAEENAFSPISPCVGEISSPFGERVHPINGQGSFHNGIDIAANALDSVYAIEDGVVEKSTYNQYSGNFIVIRHSEEYTSSYAHLSESKVNEGDTVKKGDLIGLVGSTGSATGPHLHMEIRKNGNPVNPAEFNIG